MIQMKAIIPTGGRGTRLQPFTFSANKHFIPVANKPLIFYPIETVAQTDIKEVAITYNPGFEDIVKSFLGDGSKWGLKFSYILQPKPLGLANIFEECEEWLGGSDFLLHLGDNIFVDGIVDLVKHFTSERPNGLVTMIEHPENFRLGVPYFDKKGRLKKYVEKPKNPPHKMAIPGLYFFDRHIFKCFRGKNKIKPSDRGEFEIASAYQWLLDNGYEVEVKKYDGKWLDPGKTGDWLDANNYLLDRFIKNDDGKKMGKSVKIQGRVQIGKNCKIKNTTIRGPVSIGDSVTIKDSFIGPYTSIYDNCKVENCRINNSILMNDVYLRDVNKLIDSSIIGPWSEINSNPKSGDQVEMYLGAKSTLTL